MDGLDLDEEILFHVRVLEHIVKDDVPILDINLFLVCINEEHKLFINPPLVSTFLSQTILVERFYNLEKMSRISKLRRSQIKIYFKTTIIQKRRTILECEYDEHVRHAQ